jgi:hypothetical protein
MTKFEPQHLQPAEEREYFRRRALEEETAAVTAPSLKASLVHQELAKRYRARAQALASPEHSAVAEFRRPEDAAAQAGITATGS